MSLRKQHLHEKEIDEETNPTATRNYKHTTSPIGSQQIQ